MRRPLTRRPLPLRLLTAAGALLLLAGALELHPEAAHAVDGRERLVLTCDHDGDASSLHVEAARAELREACPACLHRFQTGAAGVAAAAGFVGVVVAEPLPTVPDLAITSAPARLWLARGPPALS